MIIFFLGALTVFLGFNEALLGKKDLINLALGMFGTFFGALFAFRLNQHKEDTKIDTTREDALNRALLTLIRQYNAISNLARDIDNFQDPIERAINMPALKPPDYSKLTQDINSLDFLLNTKNPNILVELSIEDERFHQAISALNLRNDVYLKDFLPKISELQLNKKHVNIDILEEKFGFNIWNSVLNGSNYAYMHISESKKSLPKMITILYSTAKEIYPKKGFIHVLDE